jgi:hypothetical protein
MFQRMVLAACAAGALIQGAQAIAGQSTRVGDITIYHNAITADTLTPAVAATFGIERSKYRGVLNVSVIKEQTGTTGTPLGAVVDVDILDAADQRRRVPMREIEERGSVSYLGEFPVNNGQALDFEIRVRPPGAAAPISVRMSQEFFTE